MREASAASRLTAYSASQALGVRSRASPSSWISTSQHTEGRACDVEIVAKPTLELARWAATTLPTSTRSSASATTRAKARTRAGCTSRCCRPAPAATGAGAELIRGRSGGARAWRDFVNQRRPRATVGAAPISQATAAEPAGMLPWERVAKRRTLSAVAAGRPAAGVPAASRAAAVRGVPGARGVVVGQAGGRGGHPGRAFAASGPVAAGAVAASATARPSGVEPVSMSCMLGVSPRPLMTRPSRSARSACSGCCFAVQRATSLAMVTPLAFTQPAADAVARIHARCAGGAQVGAPACRRRPRWRQLRNARRRRPAAARSAPLPLPVLVTKKLIGLDGALAQLASSTASAQRWGKVGASCLLVGHGWPVKLRAPRRVSSAGAFSARRSTSRIAPVV